jgi:hypothetical protein
MKVLFLFISVLLDITYQTQKRPEPTAIVIQVLARDRHKTLMLRRKPVSWILPLIIDIQQYRYKQKQNFHRNPTIILFVCLFV